MKTRDIESIMPEGMVSWSTDASITLKHEAGLPEFVTLTQRSDPPGPNIAFDLPTQLGYDSDSPMAEGEVGRTGVAVSTLRDFEVIYEAFTGEMNIDRIASNFTINAPESYFTT